MSSKARLGKLEGLDPMSQDYLDKLEHVRGAVLHHVYQDEGTWFPALLEEGDAVLQARLTSRFREEFMRYDPRVSESAAVSSTSGASVSVSAR